MIVGPFAGATTLALAIILATAIGGRAQSPHVTDADSAHRDTIAQGQLEKPIPKQASEEAKADTKATPTPEPNEEAEEIEEMNDWRGPSPDDSLFAVTRVIPDPVYIQRHDRDSVAVGVFHLVEGEGLAVVARHDFQGRLITHIEWSPDSKFLLFTTVSSGGHSPWHAAAFLFCAADNSFRDVDAAIGDVMSPKFRFEPPDIACMEVKKGEAEEEVKVSLSKGIQQMPRVK
jgi:dipeptidyl aminopeptidase/acylaminoacyl peptidase